MATAPAGRDAGPPAEDHGIWAVAVLKRDLRDLIWRPAEICSYFGKRSETPL
jgi:hypothetical protein